MLKLFPMRHQLSHRRHPLHPSSIRDVRSLLRIRFFFHFFSRYTVLINGRDPILRDEKSLVAPNAKFDGIY